MFWGGINIFSNVVDILSAGITSCVNWFFSFFDSIDGSWQFLKAFILVSFLISLLIPFIGFRLTPFFSGSDSARPDIPTSSPRNHWGQGNYSGSSTVHQPSHTHSGYRSSSFSKSPRNYK